MPFNTGDAVKLIEKMKKLYLILGFECLISYFLVLLGICDENNEIYFGIIVFISLIQFVYVLLKLHKRNDLWLSLIFLVAYFVRLAVIFFDVGISEIDPGDSAAFRESAEHFFYTNQLVFRGNAAGFSTLFMGIISKIFGPQRAIIQYCNAMCFLVAGLITNQILKTLCVKKTIRYVCMCWMLFTPQNIKNTSLSNREGFIIFFVAVSLYFAIQYTVKKSRKNIVGAILPLIFGMAMHAGVVCVAAGYVIWFAFYDEKSEELKIKWKSVFIVLAIMILVCFAYVQFGDIFFRKFEKLSGGLVSALTSMVRHTGEVSGSTYIIPGDNSQSIFEIVLYTPLRALYFLFSPMPWYWRGAMDIIAFTVCSVPQIFIIYMSLKKVFFVQQVKRDTNKKARCLLVVLTISALAIAVVFGWGCRNAGTAIRHRDKFLSLYTLLLAFLFNDKTKSRIQIK